VYNEGCRLRECKERRLRNDIDRSINPSTHLVSQVLVFAIDCATVVYAEFLPCCPQCDYELEVIGQSFCGLLCFRASNMLHISKG